jgi:putative Mg2+ transporter-C (MgtC) family protein
VTGIGFLGAGVIFARGGNIVGITSAAVIWILAGIGSMIGFAWYKEAILVSFTTITLLAGIRFTESKLPRLLRGIYTPENDKSDMTSP